MTTTNLSAPDISCGGCANAIQRALSGLPGISDVAVDVANKTVTVQHDAQTASKDAIVGALDRAGFPATDVASGANSAQTDTAPPSCHI